MKKLAAACCLLAGLTSTAMAQNSPFGLQPVPGSYMVTLEAQADRPAFRGLVRAFGGEIRYEYTMLPDRVNVRGLAPGAAQALARAGGVKSIVPDYQVHAMMAESAPLIGAEPVPAGTGGGAGVRVCVLDTGINPNHLMFNDSPSRIAAWKDFVNGQGSPYDDEGHGSHVAGTVAGREGLQINGAPFHGVAPAATLYIGKVLDSAGSGSFADVVAGIEWCAGLAGDSPSQRADVISMSLGGGSFSTACDTSDPTGAAQASNAAAGQGVLVVTASGNENNNNAVSTPACASGAMAIGATYDADVGRLSFAGCTDRRTAPDKIACFSNEWDFLDVVAPGCIIYSADPAVNTQVVGSCGTSQATPHVAGLAALVMAANPGFSAATVRDCINSTALDLGTVGFDRTFGNGRIQALAAIACDPGTCSVTENPETSCSDGVDNDCDGATDAADPDCAGGSCSLGQVGDSCTSNSDCCSNNCKGKTGSKTCK